MSYNITIDEEKEDHLVNDILDIYNGVWNNYDEYRLGKTQINYNIDIMRDMKAKFPDFIKSVTDCSNYLNNTVAPAYEKVESTASSKIG